MSIHGICVLAPLPHFLESFFVLLADALPWVCWGEHPAPSPHSSPCSCQGREAQKLSVCWLRETADGSAVL